MFLISILGPEKKIKRGSKVFVSFMIYVASSTITCVNKIYILNNMHNYYPGKKIK